jgi:hypothetical protein
MKIAILTTQARPELKEQTEAFWKGIGWEPVYYYNDGSHPGVGRNRILKDFYAGTDEWIAIVDDDNIIDVKRGDYQAFVDNIDHVLDLAKQGNVATFSIMNNIVHRVETTLTNATVADNWCWMRSYSLSNLFFHRRTEYVPFSEEYMLEDQEWCIDQLQRGLICATLMNVVMKTIGTKSLLFTDQKHRLEEYNRAKAHWLDKYPSLKPDKNGKMSKMPLIKTHWPNPLNWSSTKGIGVAYSRLK